MRAGALPQVVILVVLDAVGNVGSLLVPRLEFILKNPRLESLLGHRALVVGRLHGLNAVVYVVTGFKKTLGFIILYYLPLEDIQIFVWAEPFITVEDGFIDNVAVKFK